MTTANDIRKNRVFWGITYLITFGLWMYAMEPVDLSDYIVGGIIAVFAAALTFVFVGMGLLILLVPVRILLNVLGDITGIRSVRKGHVGIVTKTTEPNPDDTAKGDTSSDGGCCGTGNANNDGTSDGK